MANPEAMKPVRVPGLYAACMRAIAATIGEAIPLTPHDQPTELWWERFGARIRSETGGEDVYWEVVTYYTRTDPEGLAVHTNDVHGPEYRIVFLRNAPALTVLPHNRAAIEEMTL